MKLSSAGPYVPSQQRGANRRRTGRENKMGAGMVNPLTGTRTLFPEHFVPKCGVREALGNCGQHSDFEVDAVMTTGGDLQKKLHGNISIASDRASAVRAYTQEEPPLYKLIVRACRTGGEASEKDLEKVRDYLYYLNEGLTC